MISTNIMPYDHLNLIFVRDTHAVRKKMTRNGPEIVILKYGLIFNASDVSLKIKDV